MNKIPRQLPADCLNEIFDYLEEDKVTLLSCLFVNHIWCEVSVRILWRHIDNCNTKILCTVIACLPDESKDLLDRNKIFIPAPTSKPLLFNYTSFCKALSVDEIDRLVGRLFKRKQTSRDLSSNKDLVVQEIFKMFMKQNSLKQISYYPWFGMDKIPNFTQFPGAKDCLTGLSKLGCKFNVYPEFCYQLSQICHNIQSINIESDGPILNGLKHLISSQNCLKYFSLTYSKECVDIVPLLMGCSNTLIKLKVKGCHCKFKNMQHVTFPQLQILKLQGGYPDATGLIKLLEINGKNLKVFCVKYHFKYNYDSINLAIAKFCPNLKSLYTRFYSDEGGLETLKIIFHSCEQLERIKIRFDDDITEEQILKVVKKHSPKNFQGVELYNCEPRLPFY